MKQIEISIPEKKYTVHLGENIFSKLPSLLKKQGIIGDVFLVIDSKVKNIYKNLIWDTIQQYPTKVKILSLNSKEANKSYASVQKIHTALIKYRFGRDSTLVAIGGGIVGDITGFAASTYMRGIKYVQVPTTLLAAVDSSVGGKTGINFNHTKNIIGSFYQPELVLIDTAFFNTLPDEERLCGLGEIIKYGYLTDQKFFNYIKKNNEGILSNNTKIVEKIISNSVRYKGDVVEADEKESGIRKVLNLGHTFAHAFEVEQKHKLKHGQAVIIGITCALYLSRNLNLLTNSNFKKLISLPISISKRIKITNINIPFLLRVMLLDKKNRDNEIKFVLVKDIGEIITDIPADNRIVKKSISEAILHFK